MSTSVQNSRRPVTVSSMSSLDSLIDAALDKSTVFSDDDQMQQVAESNVVSSSTLSSIGVSPTHTGSTASEKEAPVIKQEAAASLPPVAPTGMVLSAPVPVASSAPAPVASSAPPAPAPPAPNNNTVAEFLFQLSKMLTDDNSEIIEWVNGQINVHDPYRLQDEVLNRYFRHSKFASFQRQLNYFGFRKLAGKGKMAPCSYVNEATTSDIRSLLLIKRKAGGTTTKEKVAKKRSRGSSSGKAAPTAAVNPVLAGILHRSSGATLDSNAKVAASVKGRGSRGNVSSSSSQQELARAAVGKGVRHGLLPSSSTQSGATDALASASMIFPDPPHLAFPGVEESLSELQNNYRNSLQSAAAAASMPSESVSRPTEEAKSEPDPSFKMYNFLSRDSSLVDLAMLVPATNDTTAAIAPEPAAASADPAPIMSEQVMPFFDFSGVEQQPPTEKQE